MCLSVYEYCTVYPGFTVGNAPDHLNQLRILKDFLLRVRVAMFIMFLLILYLKGVGFLSGIFSPDRDDF